MHASLSYDVETSCERLFVSIEKIGKSKSAYSFGLFI